MIRIVIALLTALFFNIAAHAQDAGFATSCRIQLKAAVYPSDPANQHGKARIYVTLSTREGCPLPGQHIHLSVNYGVFSCKPRDMEDSSTTEESIDQCSMTDKNGKIMVYLMEIPFNKQGFVTAACDYGTLSVKASCTFLISRYHGSRSPK